MKKNFLQDVIPANQKRSIRDVPLPVHKNRPPSKTKAFINAGRKEDDFTEDEVFLKKEDEPALRSNKFYSSEPEKISDIDDAPDKNYYSKKQSIYKKTGNTFMKKALIGVSAAVLLILIFLFSKTEATITINPKKTITDVSTVIPTDGPDNLATKTQLTKTLTKTLVATAEQQVEKQASGRIKIINKHKETSQELVKNTRFQTPNGLIYRIRDSIVVPGYTMSESTLVPGTLEVEVFADSAGEEYNMSNIKFTIPGFAGREQFEKITAESVTDMTGGYIGIRKVVSEEAKAEALENLEGELKSQIKQTQTESTEYIIVPDIETLTYGELQDKVEGDNVTLSLSATVDAYSFVKKQLFNFIGQNSITGVSPTDGFTIKEEGLDYEVEKDTVKISGTVPIVWVTDIEQLKKDFLNKKRSEVVGVIDSYRSFEKAEAELSPFWKTRFPSDSTKIEVVITE